MTKIVGLRLQGKALGCEAGTTSLYMDRLSIGAWEKVQLTAWQSGVETAWFDAVFIAANLRLSRSPDGQWETRPIDAPIGVHEQFLIIEVPPWHTEDKDKTLLLYSREHAADWVYADWARRGAVLTVEVLG